MSRASTWRPDTRPYVITPLEMLRLTTGKTQLYTVVFTAEDCERIDARKYETHGSYEIDCKPPFEFPPPRKPEPETERARRAAWYADTCREWAEITANARRAA